MGAEHSSNNRTRLERETVEYILEQQRKLYEQRCRDLLQNHVTAQNNAHPRLASQLNQARPAASAPLRPQPPSPHVYNNVQQPINPSLDNQTRSTSQFNQARPTAATPLRPQPPPARANTTANKPQFVISENQNRSASALNQARPATAATAPPRPQPPPARVNTAVNKPNVQQQLNNQNRFERNPAPYSYRQEDLQNVTEVTGTNNLYPTLNNNAPISASGPSTSSATFRFSNNTPNSVKPVAADFVFVNKNGTVRPTPSAPRERSVSRSRDRNSENEDLKCPTCKNIFTLYIFNCGSGHSSCKECKQRGVSCGECGQHITDIRNHALEAYVGERKVPCFNKGDGCALVIKLADMENHLKECPFKEMLCPMNEVFGNCMWRGKLKQIAVHFDNQHTGQRQAEEGQEMFLPNICTENKFVHLVVKGAFNFLFHVFVSQTDRMIYMTTQLIGTKLSAQKWTCEIQIYNKREPRRKYQYVDICSSSNESVNDIYKEARCATLPLSYAMNFVNEGAICYKFSLDKTFKGRNNFHNKNNRGRGGRHHS